MTDLSGQHLGRYYLTEHLGEGGMAVVYKAYDTRLEREVALKIIRSDNFPVNALGEVLKRFEREAKSLAKLSHPSIVKVHDYGEHDGSPYLVMEYLPGGTLKKVLGKPVPWQEAARLILPVARGVAYAHRRGILHRDIKPANVLITDDGEPMLSDFGIAKLFEADQTTALTGSGMAIGTPEYMAPEQWTGTTSPLSDQYSLGIVFYELLTGRKPYEADTPAAILIKQATEPLPSPRKFAPEVPESVELILIKALAREPENRYQDLNDFIRAMENLLASAAVIPHPSPEEAVEETHKIPIQELAVLPVAEAPRDGESAAIKKDNVPELETQTIGEPLPMPRPMEKVTPRFPRKWVPVLIGVISIVIMTVLWFSSRGAPMTPAATATHTAAAMRTMVASTTPEPLVTFTVTSLPAGIMDAKGVAMRLVPVGEFTMGMDADNALSMCQVRFSDCTREQFTDEEPSHTVYLETFYMDQYEVTNAHYKTCVEAGRCQPPSSATSGVGNEIRQSYYSNPKFDNYPVLYVNWDMARAYCEWRNARLPSEAEWEKAARGTDGRIFPWGSAMVDATFANYDHALGDTWAVGSYENGVSPYGIHDLAGNVEEWVGDWYAPYPGQEAGASKNFGETYRVVRGGNWDSNEIGISAVNRDWREPGLDSSRTGFRCASPVISTLSQSTVTQTPPPEVVTGEFPTQITDGMGATMLLIPAGGFMMGSDGGGSNSSKPLHNVYLEPFYIDENEVANRLYKVCEQAGICQPPQNVRSRARSLYYGDSQFDDFPVIFVDWFMARTFCEWRGARLPTEAEWEKAARGTDGRDYAWGNITDYTTLCDNANYRPCYGDTRPVGSFDMGMSIYGVYDMTGNVAEWVSSMYSPYPYDANDGREILNQTDQRIIRGGAFDFNYFESQVFDRNPFDPNVAVDYVGIRCARSAP